MRNLVFIVTCFIVNFSFGQSFNDIAISQGITFYSSPVNSWVANGMSFYDFDEDGWDDLTFPANGDSILFYKNVNGNFQQINSYVHALGYVREILWVDYDNDLDLDIAISYDDAGFSLHQNDGNFNFTDVTSQSGISDAPFKAFGFSFADPDTDGDLDLYLCSFEIANTFTNPEPNKYYENQGDGTFIEKAQQLGIDNGAQTSFMPVWFDYDNDDELDLHIINDRVYFADAMYKNNGGNFQEVANATGISNDGHDPMSLSIADFNNDGYQDVFKTDVGDDLTSINGQTLLSKLYMYQPDTFINVAPSVGLDTNVFGWGALWVDYDNDCFEDLYISTSENFAGTGFESLLYHNNGGTSFTLSNDSLNANTLVGSFCPVKGDINNDGFYDVVVHNDNALPNVLLNSAGSNNYIKIDLQGSISNQKGIGSKIEVYANGQHQTQIVTCGSGLCAQNSQHKIFGIGSASAADSIFVTYPSGIVAIRYNLPANASYVISEQITETIDLSQGTDTVYACPGDVFVIGEPGLSNYQWINGSQDALITVESSGLYQFEATNIFGDTLFVSNSVYYDFESDLLIQEVVTNPPCGLSDSGAFELVVTSQEIINSISWSNGYSGFQNTNLSPGLYAYIIWTEHGCHYSGSQTIVEDPVFSTQVFTSPETDTDLGTAEFFMWQGFAPYQIELNQIPQPNPITGLTAGSYDAIIADANGCTDTISFTIDDLTTTGLLQLTQNKADLFYKAGAIQVCGEFETIHNLQITDMLGKNLSIDNVFVTGECHTIHAELAPGFYYVLFETESDQFSEMIFIPTE